MKRTLSLLLTILAVSAAYGADIDYSLTLTATASSHSLAPYMLGSWNGGKYVAGRALWQEGYGSVSGTKGHLGWCAGLEYIVGYGSADRYMHFADGTMTTQRAGTAPLRLQQAWGQVRWRSLEMTVGQRQQQSLIVDGHLSSGDITRSNNSRPVPGVEIGFDRFQPIPFTKGWVEIEGRIMYGRMTDTNFKKKMFNHYQGLIATDLWYTYKRCYFRTRPDKALSVLVGMQTGGLFAGKTSYYRQGTIYRHENRGFHLRDLWDMFFPTEGGEDYYKGSSLGSWDFKATWRGSRFTAEAYFEWPWEDGSGIGRRNGWDGLWGVHLHFDKCRWINDVVAEYVDFVNQGGWLHFSHTDNPGTDIASHADGADNYYNNDYYGPYANYGMSIGTPFIVSPVYNSDGSYYYLHNRSRGFHLALAGQPHARWSYTAKVSFQRAGGMGRQPARTLISNTSAAISAQHELAMLKGLSVSATIAFDRGELRGNNLGVMLSLSYSGSLATNTGKK